MAVCAFCGVDDGSCTFQHLKQAEALDYGVLTHVVLLPAKFLAADLTLTNIPQTCSDSIPVMLLKVNSMRILGHTLWGVCNPKSEKLCGSWSLACAAAIFDSVNFVFRSIGSQHDHSWKMNKGIWRFRKDIIELYFTKM